MGKPVVCGPRGRGIAVSVTIQGQTVGGRGDDERKIAVPLVEEKLLSQLGLSWVGKGKARHIVGQKISAVGLPNQLRLTTVLLGVDSVLFGQIIGYCRANDHNGVRR